MTTPGRDRASLGVVYVTVFLDLLGFGIILPFLPYYAVELGASGLGLGVLLTSYSLAQLFGAAVLGRLSDRLGRRPVLLLSLAGSTAGMVLSGLATGLVALSASRALAGLFGGSISTAQAYVADVTAPGERARFMGFLGASIGLGFVVGPALGVGLDALGFGFPGAAFVAAGLAAANLAAAAFRLRESRPDAGERAARRALPPLASAFRRPGLAAVLAATFCVTFAFVTMETTFALLGERRFGMDEHDFGLVLVGVGVIVVLVQGGLVGRLTRRYGVERVAVAGGVTMGVALLALPAAPALPWAAAAIGLLAAGQGLSSPSLATLVSKRGSVDEQGSVLGVGQSLAALARAGGPLVAGGLFDLDPVAPYALAGGLAVLAGAVVALAGRGEEAATPVATDGGADGASR